jgi:hypothetical protein
MFFLEARAPCNCTTSSNEKLATPRLAGSIVFKLATSSQQKHLDFLTLSDDLMPLRGRQIYPQIDPVAE